LGCVSLLKLRCEIILKQYPAPTKKFRADQPRVPAGDPDGGQWTDGSGGAGPMSFEEWLAGGWAAPAAADIDATNTEELGDWDESADEPTIEQVNNRSRGSGSWPGASPGQQARLAASNVQAQAAIRRVQQIEPSWRPPASMSEGIEGAILSNQAALRQAEARLRDLQGRGLGPGPFAEESVPARGPGRANAKEQAEIDRIGRLFGCHTCGTTESGTLRGNFIGDHQLPSSINRDGRPQSLYPHCFSCSRSQGGFVNPFIRGRK
jgi:hypothetical protein